VRLLFDEQLAEELCVLLRNEFPESLHVRAIGAGGASDEIVWQAARDLGCVLVTKDDDFHRLGILRGAPPKVIWIRIGNCTTADIAALLRQHQTDIERFAAEDETTVLELGGRS
jgi:predicted nuclease of predicted toxin-antitoxin system